MRNIKKSSQIQIKDLKQDSKCLTVLEGEEQDQTSDEFLDNLLHTDATLDEGTVPDIKVMDDSDINIMSGEVNASSLLDFFSQLTSKSSSSISNMPIKEEPLTEDDLKALQKDRQKKDNHNLSKTIFATINSHFYQTFILVERRRRYNINDRIKELGTLLPKENDEYFDLVRDVRQNKGSILKASVDYIKKLKVDQDRKKLLEQKCRIQEYQTRKLIAKLQLYEKQLKMHSASQAAKASGVTTNINKRRSPAPTACGANLLDNCYSKTLMDTQNMKTVDIKEEKDEICNLSGSELDDFMEDDNHPLSSSDPMLSSPAPSTLSSSPSSFYSSDENLSPESIDHLIV